MLRCRAMKALVVEDSPKLARFLSRVLGEEGYVVDLCSDGAQAIEQGVAGGYDLVLLDWMLPSTDGLTVCRELRGRGHTAPIIMLTARGETAERVLGLDAGADDFIVKPFEVEELVARARAQTRRSRGFVEISCGPIRVDRTNNRVTVDGEPLQLTTREHALLLHLMQNHGRAVKRTALLAAVWQARFDSGTNVLEVQVSRLRDKLGQRASMIETVRGVGYRLRTDSVS
jgi:DNA-binding response OmpR family regulator